MGNITYTIAAILIIGWLVGLFSFHFGPAIHILLITGLVITILRFAGGGKAQ